MSWSSVFCSVFPRFLKKNKTDRSLRFPGFFDRFFTSTAMRPAHAGVRWRAWNGAGVCAHYALRHSTYERLADVRVHVRVNHLELDGGARSWRKNKYEC